jgi:hypothetical protein
MKYAVLTESNHNEATQYGISSRKHHSCYCTSKTLFCFVGK